MNKILTINDTVPCSICGKLPILQGGNRSGRLVCPNYKNKKIQHGNLNSDTKGIPMGFTNWCYYFWTDEQTKNQGIPAVVKEWNKIHSTTGE